MPESETVEISDSQTVPEALIPASVSRTTSLQGEENVLSDSATQPPPKEQISPKDILIPQASTKGPITTTDSAAQPEGEGLISAKDIQVPEATTKDSAVPDSVTHAKAEEQISAKDMQLPEVTTKESALPDSVTQKPEAEDLVSAKDIQVPEKSTKQGLTSMANIDEELPEMITVEKMTEGPSQGTVLESKEPGQGGPLTTPLQEPPGYPKRWWAMPEDKRQVYNFEKSVSQNSIISTYYREKVIDKIEDIIEANKKKHSKQVPYLLALS